MVSVIEIITCEWHIHVARASAMLAKQVLLARVRV